MRAITIAAVLMLASSCIRIQDNAQADPSPRPRSATQQLIEQRGAERHAQAQAAMLERQRQNEENQRRVRVAAEEERTKKEDERREEQETECASDIDARMNKLWREDLYHQREQWARAWMDANCRPGEDGFDTHQLYRDAQGRLIYKSDTVGVIAHYGCPTLGRPMDVVNTKDSDGKPSQMYRSQFAPPERLTQGESRHAYDCGDRAYGPGKYLFKKAANAIINDRNVTLGIPISTDLKHDHLMNAAAYVVDYNPVLEEPNWVAWNLKASDLGTVTRLNKFHPDQLLSREQLLAVTPQDYAHSGYDKGHLCPSGDRTSTEEANFATFLMTNIEPQLHALNAGPWEKLERYERSLAEQGKSVFVVAGGIFGDDFKTIGHGVTVPKSFYKIVVALEPGQGPNDVTPSTPVVAVIMPNDESVRGTDWADYATTVDAIEQASGYDFLSAVDASVQEVVEARR